MFTNDELVAILPSLTAFSRTLIRKNKDWSDDLLQHTVLRMLEKQDQFQAGTNLKAWGFTIMQNLFLNEASIKRGKVHQAMRVPIQIELLFSLQAPVVPIDAMIDLKSAWVRLQPFQRDVMTRWIEGDTYEEIESLLGFKNVKSTMHRIREHLNDPRPRKVYKRREALQP